METGYRQFRSDSLKKNHSTYILYLIFFKNVIKSMHCYHSLEKKLKLFIEICMKNKLAIQTKIKHLLVDI